MVNLILNFLFVVLVALKYVTCNSSFGLLPPLDWSIYVGQSSIRCYIITITCQGFQIAVHHGPYTFLNLPASKRDRLWTWRKDGVPCIWKEAAVYRQRQDLSHRDAIPLRETVKVYEVRSTYEARKITMFTDRFRLPVPVTSRSLPKKRRLLNVSMRTGNIPSARDIHG